MSILINGSPTTPFKMRRGLRQEDPFSLFRFVLVAEVFNKMMERAQILGPMEGLHIGKDEVELSHLQFADDMLVFCLANKEVLLNIRRMMNCFAFMSVLCINYIK